MDTSLAVHFCTQISAKLQHQNMYVKIIHFNQPVTLVGKFLQNHRWQGEKKKRKERKGKKPSALN